MLLYGFNIHSRSTSLAHVNSMLREQLDQATDANRSLTQNIDQLNDEVRRSQEELDTREAEWRDEEKVREWYLNLYAQYKRVCSTETSFSNMKVDRAVSTGIKRTIWHLDKQVCSTETSFSNMKVDRAGSTGIKRTIWNLDKQVCSTETSFSNLKADRAGSTGKLIIWTLNRPQPVFCLLVKPTLNALRKIAYGKGLGDQHYINSTGSSKNWWVEINDLEIEKKCISWVTLAMLCVLHEYADDSCIYFLAFPVLQWLLQQWTQSAAGAMETCGRFQEKLLRDEKFNRKVIYFVCVCAVSAHFPS